MPERDYLGAVRRASNELRKRERLVAHQSALLTRVMCEAREAGISLRAIGEQARMSSPAVLKRTNGGE